MSTLTVLYRGPLAGCNYGCGYCPFAGHGAGAAELEEDHRGVRRLVDWASRRTEPLSVFFTPRGEALIHPGYAAAIVELSNLPHLRRVAIQTNLSSALDWLDRADTSRVGIWATYHPEHVARDRFLRRCAELERRGVSFSVGAVGLPALIDEIEALRVALPAQIYLWINAAKRDPSCKDEAFVRRLTAIDPLFPLNLRPQRSRGLPCRAGQSVIAVDGAGQVRRCHFLSEVIGSLDDVELAHRLSPAPVPCTADECRCHIGYVHLVPLGLDRVFGDGILERALAPDRRAAL
jgi:MoaA/NifB/PqqE/SkfB family radical SAM enzyme